MPEDSIKPGDVVHISKCTVITPDGLQVEVRAIPSTVVGVWIFLGHQNRNDTSPLDPMKRMDELGWMPKPSADDLTRRRRLTGITAKPRKFTDR